MSELTNKLAIPGAIIIAGALVAGAIIFTNASQTTQQATTGQAQKVAIREVSNKDHILGNPGAEIVIVEYSDIDCPFCQRFHTTLHDIMDQYAKDGKVAWVYRHYPIDQLHPQARKKAEASECINEIGGADKFWQFLDSIYTTPTDLAKISDLAVTLGVDKTEFDECLASGKYAAKIEADIQDGKAAGVKGTPYSMVISKKGTQVPISGAQSLSVVSQVVTTLLEEK